MQRAKLWRTPAFHFQFRYTLIHALGYNITLLAGQFEGSYVLILHCPKPWISARHLKKGAGEAAWYHDPFPITIDDTLSHPSFLLNYSILNWSQTFALFCFLFCRCSWWGQVLQKLMLPILWLNLMDVASFRLFSPGIRLLLNGIWLRAGWHTWTTV